MTEQEARELKEFLNIHTTLALATVDAQAKPRVAPVFYALGENWNLIFISKEDAEHSQHIKQSSDCAASIYQDGQDRSVITGIQCSGKVSLLKDELDESARTAYLEKYTFIAEEPEMLKRFKMMSIYEFKLQWLRLIDNRKGFGHRQEWTF